MKRAAIPLFWTSAGLLVYAQAGYGAVLWALTHRHRTPPASVRDEPADAKLPTVSVIVAAYAEAEVIGERVANLRALDYPRDRVEIVVACDGSPDDTAARARAAGADRVLELPRGGKIRAQDAAVATSTAEIVAFSDANVRWEPDALRRLVAPFAADPQVAYVCGDVRFTGGAGDNQEGLYWRYEMFLRRRESALHSVTAGNGAIYATRRTDYLVVDPVMGHDLSFPFNLVKRGRRALYAPAARASERMVPTIEGEFARKRRMMSHTWPILLRGGLLDLRGQPPRYALMLVSHRILRYATPFLHVALAAATVAAARRSRAARAGALAQGGVLAGALLAPRVAGPPPVRRALLVSRYYVLTTASIAAGLFDWLRAGTAAGWEPAPGTR